MSYLPSSIYVTRGEHCDPLHINMHIMYNILATIVLLYEHTAVYSPGPDRECIVDVTLDGNDVRYSVKAQRWRSFTLVTAQKLTS